MLQFNEKLRKTRKTMNITQTQMAEKLNINQVTYHGYESGKHKPDIDTLVRIARILNTSIDYLLNRYEETEEQVQ